MFVNLVELLAGIRFLCTDLKKSIFDMTYYLTTKLAKKLASFCIATTKSSGKRESDPRPLVWETDALPLSYSR